MTTVSNPAQHLLILVDGYIRDENKTWKMNIPYDINKVIFSFYKFMIISNILTDHESDTLYDMILNHFKYKTINCDLIYRGTRDGFGYHDFCEKCYDIKHVMVICETVKDIACGGYTSVGFTKSLGSTYKDENAFIYSIRTNNTKYPPKIFPILKAAESAAMCQWNGYLFGFANSGIALQEYCNKPGTNSGIAGLEYLPSGWTDYLQGGVRNQYGITTQIKELEVFKLTL